MRSQQVAPERTKSIAHLSEVAETIPEGKIASQGLAISLFLQGYFCLNVLPITVSVLEKSSPKRSLSLGRILSPSVRETPAVAAEFKLSWVVFKYACI